MKASPSPPCPVSLLTIADGWSHRPLPAGGASGPGCELLRLRRRMCVRTVESVSLIAGFPGDDYASASNSRRSCASRQSEPHSESTFPLETFLYRTTLALNA